MTHTRIKFCGLTRADDVRLAVELGVDYIGLVFAPHSPRKLLLGQARMLRELVPEEIAVVALAMDNTAADIEAILENVHPDLLQFHGGEDDAFCAGFGIPFLKAIAMGGGAEDAAVAAAGFPSAYGYLLDGHARGEQGGSGQRFDWKRVPRDFGRPGSNEPESNGPESSRPDSNRPDSNRHFLLAGGLSADNVGLAIRTAQPWGVDVSSGIESSPGVKNADRMRQFVDEARRADGTPRH